jgi:hypothetical protein
LSALSRSTSTRPAMIIALAFSRLSASPFCTSRRSSRIFFWVGTDGNRVSIDSQESSCRSNDSCLVEPEFFFEHIHRAVFNEAVRKAQPPHRDLF